MSLGRSVCLACLLLAARAGAQSEPDADSQVLFGRAQAAYDAGDWGIALRLLEDAYALSPRPAFLFNIAQAQRKLGQCARARDSYAGYLAAEGGSAAAGSRTAAALRELESCQEPEQVPEPSPPPTAASATPPKAVAAPTAQAPPPAGDPLALRIVTWSLIAGGTAALLAGSYFAVDADATASELERATRWDDTQSEREREGQAAATTAQVLLGTGAGLLAGALAVQLLFGGSDDPNEPRLSASVTRDSIAARYALRY